LSVQARAILQAACAAQKAGVVVRPDIMVPLVGTPEELAMQVCNESNAESALSVSFINAASGCLIRFQLLKTIADENNRLV
jgi:hypothetical protein